LPSVFAGKLSRPGCKAAELAGVGAVAGAEKTASFAVANLAGQSRCSREREDKRRIGSNRWSEWFSCWSAAAMRASRKCRPAASPKACWRARTGKTVYVSSEAGDLVHEVDAASGAITRDAVGGLRPPDVSRLMTRTVGDE
jgi:hypothetical protein